MREANILVTVKANRSKMGHSSCFGITEDNCPGVKQPKVNQRRPIELISE